MWRTKGVKSQPRFLTYKRRISIKEIEAFARKRELCALVRELQPSENAMKCIRSNKQWSIKGEKEGKKRKMINLSNKNCSETN